MKCPNCDSEDIDVDQARGDAACVNCGTVLEQNLIVNEVTYQEDARGRSNVIGQHVRADGRINTFGVLPGFSREATELTMQNGRRRLSQLVSALRLKSRHTDAALRLFRIAVERNFHKGRRMANVCCACLYVVCRLEKTPHMLLDFSDELETNVYILGHTFLKFAQLLSIDLPIIDPSLYIHRFAGKLEFGEKAHAVAMSALRLLARIKRDWMSEGRRPSGICGASLLVAARMHNFYRSVAEVARVVRIGNVVLRERLQELDRTSTAKMTTAQIEAGGGDDGKEASLAISNAAEACDPPAFQRLQNRKSTALAHKQRLAAGQVDSVANDADGNAQTGDTQGDGAATQGSQPIQFTPGKGGRTEEDAQLEGELEAALASTELQELEREAVEEATIGTGPSKSITEEDANDSIQVDVAADDGAFVEAGDARENEGDSAEKETIDEDIDLSDLDDEDTEKYINTEEEYERKKELWTEVNKEYLEKQERLEKMKRERPEEYKRLRPWRAQKKKKAETSSKAGRVADEPEEPPAPPPPKTSKKLNYAVLATLGRGSGGGLDAADAARASGRLPPIPPRAAPS